MNIKYGFNISLKCRKAFTNDNYKFLWYFVDLIRGLRTIQFYYSFYFFNIKYN